MAFAKIISPSAELHKPQISKPQLPLHPPRSGDQQIALIRSWLLGLHTGVVILSDRANPNWQAISGDVFKHDQALWAVVDGKQRLTTAAAWFSSALAVPASWFDAELVSETETTDDGEYVRFNGLTAAGQRKFGNRALFSLAEFKTASSIHDEAEVYLLVNGGGTPQADTDMQRARDVALDTNTN